jgi:hypothetical protein
MSSLDTKNNTKNLISFNPTLEQAKRRLNNTKASDSNPILEQARRRLNAKASDSNPILEQARRRLNYNPDKFKNSALEEAWRKIKQYNQPLDKEALEAQTQRLQQLRSKLTNQSTSIIPSAASDPNLSTVEFQNKLRQEEVDTSDIDSMKSVLSSTRWELNGKSLFDYLGSINKQSAQLFSQSYLKNLQKYSDTSKITTPEDKEGAYKFGTFRQLLLAEDLRKSFTPKADNKPRDVRKDFDLKILASNKILGISDEKNNPLLIEMEQVIIPMVRKKLGEEAVSKDWRQQLAFKNQDVQSTKLVTGDKLLAEINQAISDQINPETNSNLQYSLTSMKKPFEASSIAKVEDLYKSENFKGLMSLCNKDHEKFSKIIELTTKAVQDNKSLEEIQNTLSQEINNQDPKIAEYATKFTKESYEILKQIVGTEGQTSIPRIEMFKKLRMGWNHETIDPARHTLAFILDGAGTKLQFNQDESQATGTVADHRSVLRPYDRAGSNYKYVPIDDNQKLRNEIITRLDAQLNKRECKINCVNFSK